MKWQQTLALGLAAFTAITTLAAREWRSADGQRSFEAAFIALKDERIVVAGADGKQAAHPLTAFSADDQQFARYAQQVADAGAKAGPLAFEINHTIEEGWLCRLAVPPATPGGPVLFTGERFLCLPADPKSASRGPQPPRMLYPAGTRTYHPVTGAPESIRAYALTAEAAATAYFKVIAASQGDAAKQSPPVLEPDIEIITTRSLGLAVAKEGLVVAPAALAKDAQTLAIHLEGRDLPATLVKRDDKSDLILLKCAAELEPGRFAARKPVELGQSLMAVHFQRSTGKNPISTPTITRGIVSKLGNGSFRHDAAAADYAIGGYLLGDKGDVLGFYFQPRADSSKRPNLTDALAECIRTDALAAFLQSVPAAGPLRAATGSDELKDQAAALRRSSVVVVAVQEIHKPRTAPVVGGGPAVAGAGFSISRSGLRHNSKCKYYNAQFPCAATEGTPCKVCGG